MQTTTQQMFVVKVIDGDTYHSTSDRVRLRGVDAPELNEPGGQAARRKLASLIEKKWVRTLGHARDTYGRLIADVYCDGKWVNHQMREFLGQ